MSASLKIAQVECRYSSLAVLCFWRMSLH